MEVRTAAEIFGDLRVLDRERIQRRRTAARGVLKTAQAMEKIRVDTAAHVEELRAQLKRDEADALRRVAEAEARTGAAVLVAFADFEPQELATLTGLSVRMLRDWAKSAQATTDPEPEDDGTATENAAANTNARALEAQGDAVTPLPTVEPAVMPPWNGGAPRDDGGTTRAL